MAFSSGASDKTSVGKGGKSVQIKVRTVARSMTAATLVATLPRGARIIKFQTSGIASDAGTTATLSVGSTTTATEYVSAQSMLAAGAGNGVQTLVGVAGAVGGAPANPTQANMPIYVKYAETGTASTVGSWLLYVYYTTGNDLNDDNI